MCTQANKYKAELTDTELNSATELSVWCLGEDQQKQADSRMRRTGEKAGSFPALRRTKDCYTNTRKTAAGKPSE